MFPAYVRRARTSQPPCSSWHLGKTPDLFLPGLLLFLRNTMCISLSLTASLPEPEPHSMRHSTYSTEPIYIFSAEHNASNALFSAMRCVCVSRR